MKKYYMGAVAAALLLGAYACVSDDTDFSDLINDPQAPEEGEQDPEVADKYVPGLEFDLSAMDEPDETIIADDNDFCENWKIDQVVTINYKDAKAEISGDAGDCMINVNGAHVTATLGKDNINFLLQGASADGSFKLYGEKRFMVTLGNLTLSNPKGAAINSQCGKSMYLVAADGCSAFLTDGASYLISGQEDMKGCLFSEGQIIVSGTGRIDIVAQGSNALVSDDYVVVRPGVLLNVTSLAGNGIKTNDGVTIRGGRINIDVAAEGAKGINCEKGIFIHGGRIIVVSKSSQRDETDRTVSAAALKCDSTFTMTGGILLTESVGSGGKGIKSDVDVRILGGNASILTFGASDTATPRAIKADGCLQIENANVVAYSKNCSPINALGGIIVADGYAAKEESDRLFSVAY